MNDKYSILINSTDSYSDCWYPFFTLLKNIWKNIGVKIYLNCENKVFTFDGVDIYPIRNQKSFTWSECLLNAIEQIKSPIILYMQDDYFVDSVVDSKSIDEFAELMIQNPEIKTIGLTKFGSPASKAFYPDDNRLKIVRQHAKYRISLQAGMWNKECLKSYLLSDENGWMFEIFGSGRARKKKDLFLTISSDSFKKDAVINYMHTGIIKGKWHKNIPDFFKSENIDIDFSIRGLIDPTKNRIINKIQTIKKLISRPAKLKYLLP
ncbi:MAG: hypothetical protein QM751_06915 [Paludibacteraceae bacterium]